MLVDIEFGLGWVILDGFIKLPQVLLPFALICPNLPCFGLYDLSFFDDDSAWLFEFAHVALCPSSNLDKFLFYG